MTRKANIPKAIREQVWLKTCGRVYEHKCYVHWCQNKMTVFDFQKHREKRKRQLLKQIKKKEK